MRVVGKGVERSGFELLEQMDCLFDCLEMPDFRPRGVFRMTHSEMNAQDDDNARKRHEWLMENSVRKTKWVDQMPENIRPYYVITQFLPSDFKLEPGNDYVTLHIHLTDELIGLLARNFVRNLNPRDSSDHELFEFGPETLQIAGGNPQVSVRATFETGWPKDSWLFHFDYGRFKERSLNFMGLSWWDMLRDEDESRVAYLVAAAAPILNEIGPATTAGRMVRATLNANAMGALRAMVVNQGWRLAPDDESSFWVPDRASQKAIYDALVRESDLALATPTAVTIDPACEGARPRL